MVTLGSLKKRELNFYYITGTSRGIGKAIAEQLLEDPSNKVIGISREKTIEHANYRHFFLDLTDAGAISDFKFELHANPKRICLINNAGSIGFIKPIGHLDAASIVRNYTLNLIAPSVLTNAFIQTYNSTDCEKLILNISSGAGKKPVDGWAVYCASKAGLDMFSKVVYEEQEIQARHPQENIHKRFHIYSIAPGVVDTDMQTSIRSANALDFSRINDFISYKENQQLASADLVSQKYISILARHLSIKEVLSSISDYEFNHLSK